MKREPVAVFVATQRFLAMSAVVAAARRSVEPVITGDVNERLVRKDTNRTRLIEALKRLDEVQ